MKRKPRPRNKSIFTGSVTALIVVGGIWSAAVNLGIFLWALEAGKSLIEAQCLVFMTLIVIQLFKAFNFRSDCLSIFEIGVFRNKWLIGAVLVSFAMTLPLLYVPLLQEIFHTYSLNVAGWAIVVLSSASIFVVLEIAKLVIRRLARSSPQAPTVASR